MRTGLLAALLAITFTASVPLQAQVISGDLGQIERGFWTRPVGNLMRLEEDVLEIHRNYRTIVEWSEPGVPARSVTDTLVWTLPIAAVDQIRVYDAPGSVLLEGGDQDTYCHLTVAEFSCSASDMDCDAQPEFYTCRYNKSDLLELLESLQFGSTTALEVVLAD